MDWRGAPSEVDGAAAAQYAAQRAGSRTRRCFSLFPSPFLSCLHVSPLFLFSPPCPPTYAARLEYASTNISVFTRRYACAGVPRIKLRAPLFPLLRRAASESQRSRAATRELQSFVASWIKCTHETAYRVPVAWRIRSTREPVISTRVRVPRDTVTRCAGALRSRECASRAKERETPRWPRRILKS